MTREKTRRKNIRKWRRRIESLGVVNYFPDVNANNVLSFDTAISRRCARYLTSETCERRKYVNYFSSLVAHSGCLVKFYGKTGRIRCSRGEIERAVNYSFPRQEWSFECSHDPLQSFVPRPIRCRSFAHVFLNLMGRWREIDSRLHNTPGLFRGLNPTGLRRDSCPSLKMHSSLHLPSN